MSRCADCAIFSAPPISCPLDNEHYLHAGCPYIAGSSTKLNRAGSPATGCQARHASSTAEHASLPCLHHSAAGCTASLPCRIVDKGTSGPRATIDHCDAQHPPIYRQGYAQCLKSYPLELNTSFRTLAQALLDDLCGRPQYNLSLPESAMLLQVVTDT